MPGLLLNMIKELPYNQRSEEYMPLSRVQIYSAEDDSMSLNLFVYGEEPKQLSVADVTMTGSHILEYAQQLMDGMLPPNDEYGRPNPKPNKIFERERLIKHMEKCGESYIIRSDPRRFMSHYELFEKVSGSDNISVSIEVSSISACYVLSLYTHILNILLLQYCHRTAFMMNYQIKNIIGLILHWLILSHTLHLSKLLSLCTCMVLMSFELILITLVTETMEQLLSCVCW